MVEFALGAVRHRQLAAGQVAPLLELAQEVVRTPEPLVDGAAVMALAVKSGCSAYDCEFVWLARELGVKLVSGDKKVLAAFPRVAVSLQAFLQSGR